MTNFTSRSNKFAFPFFHISKQFCSQFMWFSLFMSPCLLSLSFLQPINSIIIVFSPFRFHVSSSSSTLYGKLFFSIILYDFYRSNFFAWKFVFKIGEKNSKLHYRPHVAVASNRKRKSHRFQSKVFWLTWKEMSLNWKCFFPFKFSFFDRQRKHFPHVREMMKTHWVSRCGSNILFFCFELFYLLRIVKYWFL